jgi:hypothetical protein
MRTTRFFPALASFALVSVALLAQAPPPDASGAAAPPDQPGKGVARISVLNGDAAVKHSDAGDWIAAVLNAPLLAGDTLSVTPGATVELQMDSANFARVAGDSEVHIASLDNGHYQLQLAKGLVTYRSLRQSSASGEVDTPLVAVRPTGLAAVRVEVSPDSSTRVTVRHGDVEIYTPKGTEQVHEGNSMVLRGSADDPEFQVMAAIAPDAWDTWNDQRDTYLTRAQSPRYVNPDITGAEDLDNYGRWGNDPQYGDVWTPNVPTGWAPYRNGQWVWNDAYGWTWVDYDPWGWAPFHYGSWYFRTGIGWSWFPGARYGHYWYRPALVSFFGFGGVGVGFGFGNIGWVALAPFEIFHPWYGGGRGFGFNSVNVVRNVNIVNVYRNARVAGGATSVTSAEFQRGNFRGATSVGTAQLASASSIRGAGPIAPSAANRNFTNRSVSAAGPRAQVAGQHFASAPMNGARPAASGAPGWQRFNGQQAAQSQGQRFGSGPAASGGARSLQVAPPIVRQGASAPGSANHTPGSFGAPSYRSAPAPAQSPSYRAPSAPAPARSAPAPSAPRGNSGGGHASSGGHGGGSRR